jgi:hypothetical protein
LASAAAAAVAACACAAESAAWALATESVFTGAGAVSGGFLEQADTAAIAASVTTRERRWRM